MVVPICNLRFGMFENLKKRNLSADGTLSGQKKLLCGLGEECVSVSRLYLKHDIVL